jgi:hypothetical protein
MQMLARIRRTISYSPTGLSTVVASMHNLPWDSRVTLQPNSPSSSPHTEMSERLGIAAKDDLPGARIVAAIIGREAFFEPLTVTLPESLTGPSTRNMSMMRFPLTIGGWQLTIAQ